MMTVKSFRLDIMDENVEFIWFRLDDSTDDLESILIQANKSSMDQTEAMKADLGLALWSLSMHVLPHLEEAFGIINGVAERQQVGPTDL